MEYSITRGLVISEEPKITAIGSTNNKAILASINGTIKDKNIDTVKYLLLPSISNSDFLFYAKI